MKTYDMGAGTHGTDSRWLYRWWQRIRNAFDRERELITLRNVVGMMSEARRGDASEYHEMHEALIRMREIARGAREPLPRVRGVSRDADSPGGTGYVVFFERPLTDDELRSLHQRLAVATETTGSAA